MGGDIAVWPHLLRHTAATTMLRQGTPRDVVQELLGHVSATSMQPYIHVAIRTSAAPSSGWRGSFGGDDDHQPGPPAAAAGATSDRLGPAGLERVAAATTPHPVANSGMGPKCVDVHRRSRSPSDRDARMPDRRLPQRHQGEPTAQLLPALSEGHLLLA
ncbi:tyrosine-type recombinase/integrase [Nonomuraea thailandensis]|uniref:tyrosine-type recombinase/integrase n=1 Tax=Nonomuraea thailandensis TaxID=1188745 RepID=UPI003555D6EE